MAEEAIDILSRRLHLCCHAVATTTFATVSAAATSTTASTVTFAAISTSITVTTNPTKPRLTAATVAISAAA
eukprot:7365273-Ditylum_brightwellii.AAC.1